MVIGRAMGIALLLAGLVSLASASARAGTVIDDWANIKAPPPPELQTVTVDPQTTALLLLDFVHPICDPQKKPRCVASLPAMKKLLGEARANHVMVVYSTAGTTTAKDIWDRADAGRADRQLASRQVPGYRPGKNP